MGSGLRSQVSGLRDPIVDSLRGLGIILIVVGHVIIWLNRSGVIFPNDILIKDYVYSFHVPLLFIVSGFVHGIKDRFNDGKGYFFHAKKSFVDIYLPYLLFSYLGWFTSIIFFSPSSNPINFNAANYSEFFRIPYIGFREYWYLCTLFEIKLVHTALECRLKSRIPIIIFWVLIFLLINYVNQNIFSLPVYVFRFSRGIYFCAGYVMKKFNLISRDRNPGVLLGIILFIAGTLCFFAPVHNLFISTLTTSSICLGLFSLFYALEVKNKFLVSCGVISMVIYIVHDYVIFSLTLIYRFTGFLSSTPLIADLLCLILAVLVPHLVVKIYRNVKFLHWVEYTFYPGKLLLKK